MANKHVHFDLDQVERSIRKMFDDAKRLPEPSGLQEKFFFHAQNETADIAVAFAKWRMTLEMQGHELENIGAVVGVECAELAVQFINTFTDPDNVIQAANLVCQAFAHQVTANVNRILIVAPASAECDLSPIQGGTA